MRIGVYASGLLFLGGIWVAIMPEIVGFHPAAGNPWTTPSLLAATLGGGIAIAALVGLAGFGARFLREREDALRRLAEERAEASEETPVSAEPVRAVGDGRTETGVRKLSRVERAERQTSSRFGADEMNDASLKRLAETILQDMEKGPSH